MTDFNKLYYRTLKSKIPENDPIAEADICRKSLFLIYNEDIKSLDNSSTCHLLGQNLEEYSSKVLFDEGRSIYTDLLEQCNPDFQSHVQFRTNPEFLNNLDLASFIEDLSCENGAKFYCKESETVADAELTDFLSLFKPNNIVHRSSISNRLTDHHEQGNEKEEKRNKRAAHYPSDFKTAKEEIVLEQIIARKQDSNLSINQGESPSLQKCKGVGLARRSVKSKFRPPRKVTTNAEDSQNESNEPQAN